MVFGRLDGLSMFVIPLWVTSRGPHRTSKADGQPQSPWDRAAFKRRMKQRRGPGRFHQSHWIIRERGGYLGWQLVVYTRGLGCLLVSWIGRITQKYDIE